MAVSPRDLVDAFLHGPDPEEETPAARPTPPMHEPVEREPDSGNMRACYICGRDLEQLPESQVVRRFREYGLTANYVISFCGRCARSWNL